VYLSPSEAVDKAIPVMNTLPAAKTFSKSAPRNGNVAPGSAFKSPAAQNKASFQPGGLSGTVTYKVQESSPVLPLLLLFNATEIIGVVPRPGHSLPCVIASFSLQRAAPFF